MSPANVPSIPVDSFTGIHNKIDPQALGFGGFVSSANINIDSSGKHISSRDGRALLNATAFRGAFATINMQRCFAVDTSGNLIAWTGSPVTLRAGFTGYPYWTQIGDFVFVGNENQCWVINPDNSVADNAIAQAQPLLLTPVANDSHALLQPGLYATLQPGQYRFIQVAVVNGRESAPSIESTITTDGTTSIQVSGITGQRIYVAPANSRVFQWWTDTNQSTLVYAQAAETLGEELRSNNLQPMPTGRCLANYQGRLHASNYDARTDQTAIYRSMPFWWGLCDPMDFKLVPGEVRAMAGLADGLVVCTDRQIGSLDTNDAWIPFADYGVPPGQSIALDAKVIGEPARKCWIWTQRGVVLGLPFEEATPQFAPPVCNFVGTAIVRKRGDERFVATYSQSDVPDNSAF